MSTRTGDVINALVALTSAAPAFTGPDVGVLDGPKIAGNWPHRVLCIGWDGTTSNTLAADITAEWAGMAAGALRRDETIKVTGALAAWSGNEKQVAALRNVAVGMFGDFEDVLRGAIDLGLGAPTRAELAAGQLYQEQAREGLQARLTFTVTVHTRT